MEITKPDQCVVGCCFPLTRDLFYSFYESGDKGFVRSQLGKFSTLTKESLWIDIYGPFASQVSETLNEVEKYGVCVIHNFSLADLQKIESFSVFTLFAHHNSEDGRIEFADGLYTSPEFVAAIPLRFAGIFDFAVCNSTLVRNYVKKSFQDRLTISYGIEVPITQAHLIYRQIIRNLSLTSIHYIDCYYKTIAAIKKKP